MSRTAKLFQNGRSQAVRLPAEFRFEGNQVFIHRDLKTGNVILSRKPDSWQSYFELVKNLNIHQDFMKEREDSPPQVRDLFK
jgi:antitoxin VapB